MNEIQKLKNARKIPPVPQIGNKHITNHTIPSERIGKRILMWLAVSFPILWIGHSAVLGLGFILGEHFQFSFHFLAMIYGVLFIQSTSDVYNGISTQLHNRNTLLGYLYAIGLSVANLGFWLLAINSSLTPFVVLFMIGTGLITGRWTELQMRTQVYSERKHLYLNKSVERTFPIEYLKMVFNAVRKGHLSALRTLPGRCSPNCCRVQMHYNNTFSEAIINIETELEQAFSLCGLTFVLPTTVKNVVYSMHINTLENNETNKAR